MHKPRLLGVLYTLGFCTVAFAEDAVKSQASPPSKWDEPFGDIFDKLIRPSEEDVQGDVLESRLLDKAKHDPAFVEQLLHHLVGIRTKYAKVRDDREKSDNDGVKSPAVHGVVGAPEHLTQTLTRAKDPVLSGDDLFSKPPALIVKQTPATRVVKMTTSSGPTHTASTPDVDDFEKEVMGRAPPSVPPPPPTDEDVVHAMPAGFFFKSPAATNVDETLEVLEPIEPQVSSDKLTTRSLRSPPSAPPRVPMDGSKTTTTIIPEPTKIITLPRFRGALRPPVTAVRHETAEAWNERQLRARSLLSREAALDKARLRRPLIREATAWNPPTLPAKGKEEEGKTEEKEKREGTSSTLAAASSSTSRPVEASMAEKAEYVVPVFDRTTTPSPERARLLGGIHYDAQKNQTVYRYFWKVGQEEKDVHVPASMKPVEPNGKKPAFVPVWNTSPPSRTTPRPSTAPRSTTPKRIFASRPTTTSPQPSATPEDFPNEEEIEQAARVPIFTPNGSSYFQAIGSFEDISRATVDEAAESSIDDAGLNQLLQKQGRDGATPAEAKWFGPDTGNPHVKEFEFLSAPAPKRSIKDFAAAQEAVKTAGMAPFPAPLPPMPIDPEFVEAVSEVLESSITRHRSASSPSFGPLSLRPAATPPPSPSTTTPMPVDEFLAQLETEGGSKDPSEGDEYATPEIVTAKAPVTTTRRMTIHKVTPPPTEVSIIEEWSRNTKAVTSTEPEWTQDEVVESSSSQFQESQQSSSVFHATDRLWPVDASTTSKQKPNGGYGGRRLLKRPQLTRRTLDTSRLFVKALSTDDRQSASVRELDRLLGPSTVLNEDEEEESVEVVTPALARGGTQLLVQELQRELTTDGFDDTCLSTRCDFEDGSMCLYESSADELAFDDYELRSRRHKRSEEDLASLVLVRAWTNWGGAKGTVAMASVHRAAMQQERNERFAGVLVNPNEMAMLSTQLNAKRDVRVLFDAWEGTRGVQLRVCCDSDCTFATEVGVQKGHRNWLPREVNCPASTRQISFECINTGTFRGACGIDNVRVDGCSLAA